MVLCVVKVCRSGQAGELSSPDPLACPTIWAERHGGRRGGLSLQPLRQFTQAGGGGRTEATAADHRSVPAAWGYHGPQTRPRRGKWIRPNRCPCQESGGWRRSVGPVVLEVCSSGGTRAQVPASPSRGSPHTRGLSVAGLLPVASAFSGWLTHPQTQPFLWLWQAQPLPLGVGLLRPSQVSLGGGQARSLPVVQRKKSWAPRSRHWPEVTQLVSEPRAPTSPPPCS